MTLIQIIGVLLMVVMPICRLGYTIAKHGQEKEKDTYNWYYSLIALIIVYVLYYNLGVFQLLFGK